MSECPHCGWNWRDCTCKLTEAAPAPCAYCEAIPPARHTIDCPNGLDRRVAPDADTVDAIAWAKCWPNPKRDAPAPEFQKTWPNCPTCGKDLRPQEPKPAEALSVEHSALQRAERTRDEYRKQLEDNEWKAEAMLQEKLREAETRIKGLRATCGDYEARIADLQKRGDACAAKCEEWRRRSGALEASASNAEARVKELEACVSAFETDTLELTRTLVGEQKRAEAAERERDEARAAFSETLDGKRIGALEQERDRLRAENAELKEEIQGLYEDAAGSSI